MNPKPQLFSKLKEYQRNGRYPFHMPGHKRRIEELCGGDFPNPFAIDITEIEGFDNLHHPEGVIRESMEWAASVYGTRKSYYLINGSSSGILAAVCGTADLDGSILVGRNAHKSIYHAIFLNRLKTTYIYPQNSDKLGIQCGLLSKKADELLTTHPEIRVMVITSPTYDGMVSDVEALAETAHRHGVLLIVDEAHGAHFPFGGHGKWFPKSALECGADLVIQSVHKTLPSLTQTAILHVNSDRVDIRRLEYYLQIFQSSSPSYVLMASVEQCIRTMTETGEARIAAYMQYLREIRKELKEMKHLKLADRELVGQLGVRDLDESKVVVSCRGCLRRMDGKDGRNGKDRREKTAGAFGKRHALDGATLADILREEYQLEPEMCGADYVVMLSSFLDTKEGLERMKNAFLEIDAGLTAEDPAEKTETETLPEIKTLPEAEVVCRISEAVSAEKESIFFSEAINRVSAEFIYLYPPGIPIIAPGERLKDEIVERILRYRDMGLPVQGLADNQVKKIMCIK